MEEEDCVLDFELFQGRQLRVRLYYEVTNAAAIKSMVLASSLPHQCMIATADAVVDKLHIHVAAHNALTSQAHGTMKTQSLEQELLFQLGSNRQIQKSLEDFGLRDDSTCIVVAMFDATRPTMDQVTTLIEGSAISCKDFDRLQFDHSLVQKIFQLEPAEMACHDAIVSSVVGKVGAKDCFRSK